MQSELEEIRASWYEAYVGGDVSRLALFESPRFVAIGVDGIDVQPNRLEGIAKAVRAGRWFPPGSKAVDKSLSWQVITSEVVTAYGVGQIRTPRGLGPSVKFSELWQRDDAGWRVVQLHVSEQSS